MGTVATVDEAMPRDDDKRLISNRIAAVNELQKPSEHISANLSSIVDRIRPSIESVVAEDQELPQDKLMRQAVRANVRSSVDQLRRGSRILEELIAKNGLMVVGAEYSLETGVVDFF